MKFLLSISGKYIYYKYILNKTLDLDLKSNILHGLGARYLGVYILTKFNFVSVEHKIIFARFISSYKNKAIQLLITQLIKIKYMQIMFLLKWRISNAINIYNILKLHISNNNHGTYMIKCKDYF